MSNTHWLSLNTMFSWLGMVKENIYARFGKWDSLACAIGFFEKFQANVDIWKKSNKSVDRSNKQ